VGHVQSADFAGAHAVDCRESPISAMDSRVAAWYPANTTRFTELEWVAVWTPTGVDVSWLQDVFADWYMRTLIS
jgi:hypothetical protein